VDDKDFAAPAAGETHAIGSVAYLLSVDSLLRQHSTRTEDFELSHGHEIRLVRAQAERVVAEYKPLLDMEEKALGEAGAGAVSKDRNTLRGIGTAIAGFGKNPQAFNGPIGFVFFEWLDDACRNALLTAVNMSNTATAALIEGDKDGARERLSLAKDFANVSTSFYAVSENAGALYTRYAEGEQALAAQGLQVATDCTDILKKQKTQSKQQ
jgi:hypothetical protein